MKFIITDAKNIHRFRLPQDKQKNYTLNIRLYLSNSFINEIITLKKEEEYWTLNSSEEFTILKDEKRIKKVIFNNDLSFDIKFKNYPDICHVFISSGKQDYKAYIVKDLSNISIGNSSDCVISCPDLKDQAAIIEKHDQQSYIYKTGNYNDIFVNSKSVEKGVLSIGDNIFIGGINIIYMRSIIFVSSPFSAVSLEGVQEYVLQEESIPDLAPVSEAEKNIRLYDENQLFAHSPRLKVEIEPAEIQIDAPPNKENTQRTPAILGAASQITMLLVSSTSIINSFVNYRNKNTGAFELILELVVFGLMFISSFLIPSAIDRWEISQEKKREKLRVEKYTSYLQSVVQNINETISKQEDIIKYNNISLDMIINNISDKGILWDREIFDNDFLTLMLGIGNRPAQITIQAPQKSFELEDDDLKDMVESIKGTKLELKNIPITLSIMDNKVLPIVVNDEIAEEYIKSMMLQIIYHHSGKDLKVVIVTNKDNENKWSFMKNLSHNWTNDYSKRFFATDEEELFEIISYLEQEYNSRKESGFDCKKSNSERYLIVSDNYALLKNTSLVDKISLEEDRGFYGLIFSNNINNTISRFTKLVEVHPDKGIIINRDINNDERIEFIPNINPAIDIVFLSKYIANKPINIKSSQSAIPSSLSFLDMYKVGRIEQLNILNRWKENNPTSSLKAPVGVKENNKLIDLDLHEKYHGPHGLIAGSTGSGKTEFIITFILSMAINYHPNEVQFVIIDYKGGSLAGAFENRETGLRLPHLAGTITNLDKSEMNRTLVSINSELQRRQKLFNETREKLDEGTIDIYKYQRLYREGKVEKPLSHLYIISDEFAELKDQQPDFMDELISTARIGRSLGVHLILATQKPSGVVDDQIWSNSRFRVCLKVQTTDDSQEMLKRPEAAYITEAGRFYLQVGNDEIFDLGQSGWTGAKYIPSDRSSLKVEDNITFLSNTGDVIKEINEEIKKDDSEDHGEQLGNIVKYLAQLAAQENINTQLLWLDNIPSIIYYNKINKKYNFITKPYNIEALIGEYDDPSHQRQGAVGLSLSKEGNTFIIGATGSGKTNLLTTIIYSNIINHDSKELNIYIIDMGAGKLKLFRKAPQVGDVLTADDGDKVKFLFYMLKDEKERRFEYYSENGGEYLKDVEMGKVPFPTILVIINDLEAFKERFTDQYDDEFGPFVRNCAKVGIIFIVTSTDASALGYNIDSFPKKIMLNMMDPMEYKYVFNNNAPVPKKNPGRGVIEIGGEPYEFQVPLIFEDNSYNKNMSFVLNQLSVYLLKKAPRVPIIPEEIDAETIKSKVTNITKVPLGINTNTAQMGYYNFNDLVNVISSNSYSTAKKFFNFLIDILSLIQNNKIIIMNALDDCSLTIPNGVKYFDAGFERVLEVINKNIDKYLDETKEDTFCILVLGYGKFVNQITDSESNLRLDDLVLKSKSVNNFKFILYDTEEELQIIDQTEFDGFFKRNNGIWLGKDFDSQNLFELNGLYNDSTLNNTVTLVNNGNAQNIKYN